MHSSQLHAGDSPDFMNNAWFGGPHFILDYHGSGHYREFFLSDPFIEYFAEPSPDVDIPGRHRP